MSATDAAPCRVCGWWEWNHERSVDGAMAGVCWKYQPPSLLLDAAQEALDQDG